MEIPAKNIMSAQTPPLSVGEAVALFDHLANMDHLAFDWAKEGCYARAHLMCREMQDLGHMPSKAWAFEGCDGRLGMRQPSGVQIEWWYHVAPALPVVRPGGEVQICVFDPAIFDGPVPLAQWARAIRARPEDTCVAAFGVGPFGARNDYCPDDRRDGHDVIGQATTAHTDEKATRVVRENSEIINWHGVAPRVVYSTEIREEAEAAFGHALPKEGRRWVAMPLHNAREADNHEAVARLTDGVRPPPPPAPQTLRKR